MIKITIKKNNEKYKWLFDAQWREKPHQSLYTTIITIDIGYKIEILTVFDKCCERNLFLTNGMIDIFITNIFQLNSSNHSNECEKNIAGNDILISYLDMVITITTIIENNAILSTLGASNCKPNYCNLCDSSWNLSRKVEKMYITKKEEKTKISAIETAFFFFFDWLVFIFIPWHCLVNHSKCVRTCKHSIIMACKQMKGATYGWLYYT